MLNTENLIISSFLWSFFWILGILISVKKFPWTIVHDYPPAVREFAQIPTPTTGQKRNALIFMVLSSIFIMAFPIISIFIGYDLQKISFFTILLHIFIMSMTWNFVDLLIVDWLFICALSWKIFFIPGLEGRKENKDYKFHFVGFVKGFFVMSIVAFVLSSIAYLIVIFIK